MPNTSASGGYLTPTNPHPTGDIDFARVLNNLVVGITGLPGSLVRPRWQEVPSPIPTITTDWAAVGVTEIAGENGDAYHKQYDDHMSQRNGEILTILVSFYGPNSEKNARILRDGMFINQNYEEVIETSGLHPVDSGPIRTLPEQVNDRWYRRADMEIRLKRDINRDYGILTILEANGHIQGDANGLPRTQEWAVTEDM